MIPHHRMGVTQVGAALERVADILRDGVHGQALREWVPALLLLAWCNDNLPWGDDPERGPGNPLFQGWRLPRRAGLDTLLDQGAHPEEALSRAFLALESANPRLEGVFTALGLDRPQVSAASPSWRTGLAQAVAVLSRLDLGAAAMDPPDAAGQALQRFLHGVAGEWKSGIGSFYTPPGLVRLLVELADPEPGMSVGDPTCGSGGLLIGAARHVARRQKLRLGMDRINLTLQGQDVHPAAWATARVLTTLHGLPQAQLALGNVLTDPAFTDGSALPRYDRVLSAPPPSLGNWGAETARRDPFNRFAHVPPRNAGDYAFVQHALATLKDNGVAVLLLPSSALFRSTETDIRASLLINRNVVDAVIALPPNLLFGVGIAPAVMVLRKGRWPGEGVLLVDASAEMTPARPRNLLGEDHAARIVATYRTRGEEDGFSRVVDVETLEDNEFDLRPSRYVGVAVEFARRAVEDLLAELAAVEAIRDGAADEIDDLIAELRRATGQSPDG